MAAPTYDALESIERRRVQLQENVDKLRKALSHWTTWEAEYRLLEEEIQSAGDPSPSQIREIARDLRSLLVNEKEVEELLGQNRQTTRNANQVVDIISRRIDYVQQNSATIERQLSAAEKQLAGVDVLLEPGMENEDGLPMMDIEEELDDAGNEISSSVNQTGKAAGEIVEALRKAGLRKAELQNENAAQPLEEHPSTPLPSASTSVVVGEPTLVPAPTETKSGLPNPESILERPQEPASSAKNIEHEVKQKSALEMHGYNDDLAATNFSSGTKVIELDADENMVASYPVIPQGESPEDADLRRQMLQYGLSEVGQVVAELDLDQPTASYSDDDMDDDYGDYTTEEEEEDEYGRSTKPMLTEEYRKQMLDLEKKLGARMLENVGPRPDASPLAEHIGDIRTMRVRKDDQFAQSIEAPTSRLPKVETDSQLKKKGVRFADAVDISEAPQPERKQSEATLHDGERVATMSDTIVEHPTSIRQSPVEPSKPAKVSKFKTARAQSKQSSNMLPPPALPEIPLVPTGPTGRTLANAITEHVPSSSEPRAPDEFDPVVLNREIQAEYHKARNKFIQLQGGFKPSEEDDESPIVEERDGKTKKVSRFMAARLKASGM
ncbi:Nn.00g086260.m01.CDS01 [Neocucurbitaria sp. VM-36]